MSVAAPREVIDQLAVETAQGVAGSVVLPPPSFNPTGELLKLD